jgi:hypothetical protein
VSKVGTLLGSSSLPTQCRKHRLGQGLTGLGGSVAFRACIAQVTFGGGLGNRPIRCATFAPALDRMPSSIFAFVA